MAELKASPRNKYVGKVADVLRSIRDTGDEVQLPVLGGLGSLFLGKSPEEINEWSYGNAPMQLTSQGDRLPKMKRGRGAQVADTAFAAMDLPALRALTAAAGRPLARALEDSPLTRAAEFVGEQRTPVSAVVKPKGGNWLTGSVEYALRGLKRPEPEIDTGRNLTQEAGNFIRQNFPGLDDEYDAAFRASGKHSMDFARGYWPWLRENHPEVLEALSSRSTPSARINQWIEGPLTKYVKTRMASPEDEVRKLAEQGVLHFEPEPTRWAAERGREMSPTGAVLGKAPAARAWEDATDAEVITNPAKHWRVEPLDSEDWLGRLAQQNPNALVHQMSHDKGLSFANNLGFPHLIDELSNALNPASGLPRNLQLTPEAMKQLSMEKAVRRVAEINEWRAAQKIEANRKLAEQASLVREYAENNPKGLRWVELKKSESLPEGWVMEGERFRSPEGGLFSDLSDPRRQALADQLKYEGDTMGHCVGGYCDDVLSGRSRIFSLRDAKGEPHVTVEVTPTDPFNYAALPPEIRNALNKTEATDYGNTTEFVQKYFPEYYAANKDQSMMAIKQIKGKQNRAPNEEYLPFVQDFVRNSPLGGQWSEVGDLGNTGLTKHPTGKFVTDAEAEALAKKHFGDVKMGNRPDDMENPWQYANRIRRYDPEMLSDTDKAFLADWEAGNFASGGPVTVARPSWDIFTDN